MIAKAWESGGRKRIEGPTLLALLDGVLDAVDVPVVAAGGIATSRGVAAVLAAGADGVRVGTRFIAAAESDAHPAWVEAVIAANAEEAVVSTVFNAGLPEPGPHRVLRGSIEAAEALADTQAGVIRVAGLELPVPASALSRRRANRPARSPRCRSTPASPPAPSGRCSPPRRSSPSSRPGCARHHGCGGSRQSDRSPVRPGGPVALDTIADPFVYDSGSRCDGDGARPAAVNRPPLLRLPKRTFPDGIGRYDRRMEAQLGTDWVGHEMTVMRAIRPNSSMMSPPPSRHSNATGASTPVSVPPP